MAVFLDLPNDVLLHLVSWMTDRLEHPATMISLVSTCVHLRGLGLSAMFRTLPPQAADNHITRAFYISNKLADTVISSSAMRSTTRTLGLTDMMVDLTNGTCQPTAFDFQHLATFLRSFERLTTLSIMIWSTQELYMHRAIHDQALVPLLPNVKNLSTCENTTWLKNHCPKLESYHLMMSSQLFWHLHAPAQPQPKLRQLKDEAATKLYETILCPVLLRLASGLRFTKSTITGWAINEFVLGDIATHLPWLQTLDMASANARWRFNFLLIKLKRFPNLQKLSVGRPPFFCTFASVQEQADHQRCLMDIGSCEITGYLIFNACKSLLSIRSGSVALYRATIMPIRRYSDNEATAVRWTEKDAEWLTYKSNYFEHLDAGEWLETEQGQKFARLMWRQ